MIIIDAKLYLSTEVLDMHNYNTNTSEIMFRAHTKLHNQFDAVGSVVQFNWTNNSVTSSSCLKRREDSKAKVVVGGYGIKCQKVNYIIDATKYCIGQGYSSIV